MVVEVTAFYKSSTVVPKTQTPPVIRNIHISNITGQGAKQAVDIVGLPESPVQDVVIENVDIATDRGVHCEDCKNLRVSGAKIAPGSGPRFELANVENVTIDRSCSKDAKDCVEVSGDKSRNVKVDGAPVSVSKRKASVSSR
jgi:hypothetical protein